VYGSLLTYKGRGNTDLTRQSNDICTAVKRADPSTIASAVNLILARQYGAEMLIDFFRDATLVPVPGSGIPYAGQISAPITIANQIVGPGLARDVQYLVQRARAVPKSAFAAPADRPTVDVHYDSLVFTGQTLLHPAKIILVDDVITQGRIAYACFQHLRERCPNAQIFSFSLIRTMGFEQEVLAIVKPCIGTITYNGERTNRSHNYYTD
jgi:pyrimidine operon attenuation protein/uracil phosphoribosyltransferase